MNNGAWIDIGDNHHIRFVQYEGDLRSGIDDKHLTKDGKECRGFLAIRGGAWDKSFNGSIASWDMLNADPLTLSPSVLCRVCGDHGFIREGKWVKA